MNELGQHALHGENLVALVGGSSTSVGWITDRVAGTLSRPLPGHSIGLAHSDEIYRQEEAQIHPHAARCKFDARQRRLARRTCTHRRCAVLIRHGSNQFIVLTHERACLQHRREPLLPRLQSRRRAVPAQLVPDADLQFDDAGGAACGQNARLQQAIGRSMGHASLLAVALRPPLRGSEPGAKRAAQLPACGTSADPLTSRTPWTSTLCGEARHLAPGRSAPR